VTDRLPRSADVVVIGGGVVGMSVALELVQSGRQVLLIDRGRLGAASTSKNAGGIRHQFYQDANILAAQETVARVRRLSAEHSLDLGYRQVGYLLMYHTEAQRARLAEGVVRQNELGVDTRFIDVDEIKTLAPDVQTEGVLGACFGPHDGFFDPPALAEALREIVLRSAVTVVEDARVTAIEVSNGRITSVTTSAGAVSPGVVVNAAGAWAPPISRLYGESLPIAARRSQVFIMENVPPLAPQMPHTFDCEARFYVRTHGVDVWSGAAFKPVLDEAPPGPGLDVDWLEATELARRIGERIPILAGRSFTRAWAGVIEVTADDNPILGWVHHDNMYSAAGFSGHGMCVGMGLAPSIAGEINHTEPPIPLDIYRLDRFAAGTPSRTEGLWLRERPSRFEEWLAPLSDATTTVGSAP
jgi:sarcosine oxidase subunit beta